MNILTLSPSLVSLVIVPKTNAARESTLSRRFSINGALLKQADRDAGRGDSELTTAEREELIRLRREIRQVKIERQDSHWAQACNG